MMRGPIRGGGEKVEAPGGRHREAREGLVLRIEGDHHRAPGLVFDGAPEEDLSGPWNLHLAAVVDGHDPRVGGIDVVASHDYRAAEAGSDGPVVDTHAALQGERQQGGGEAGVEDHELHPTHAVRGRLDSAGGRGPQAAGGIGEVRDQEPADQGAQQGQAPRAGHGTPSHRARLACRPPGRKWPGTQLRMGRIYNLPSAALCPRLPSVRVRLHLKRGVGGLDLAHGRTMPATDPGYAGDPLVFPPPAGPRGLCQAPGPPASGWEA